MSMSRNMVLVIVLLAWAPAAAQVPRVPDEVHTLMQDRNYQEALRAIDAAASSDEVDQDYLLYLKGRAFHLLKQYDDALATFDVVINKYPDSVWLRRVKFAKGISFARKGDFRAAEQVYREEASYLLSLERKQEIADIYLEFADSFFDPDADDRQPDYAKALQFYQQALEVGPQEESRVQIRLLIARCHLKLQQYPQAIGHFEQFIEQHLDHALCIEARFLLGRAQLEAGDAVAARRTWQDLIELHQDSSAPRIAEASFELSSTYNLPEPDSSESLGLGVAALRQFLQKYPDHELASKAHLRIAQSYHNAGRFEDAVAALRGFLADARYAQSDEFPEARYLLGFGYKMQQNFDEALATWREFLTQHPTHQSWNTVQREIIDTEFIRAATLRDDKKYADARRLWSEFLVKYPLDARNAAILLEFGDMQFAEKKWNEAINDWRRLVSKYPETGESSQAQFRIASTLEEQLGQFDEALKEYRKLTWGPRVRAAQQRIARLTSKQLKVSTERVFRSQETPRLKLASRNLDKVNVRIFSVDLETYFRKMHLAQGVERLDIALIDPDHSFEFEVPQYEPYRQFDSTIEVPLPALGEDAAARNSGVIAVTVSSETLEATTLVLQSDLDMVVKCSRDELFVFAENMRSGTPWPGVKLLISDGKNVFATGTTNDDGVFQQSFEPLKSSNDVRVFAIQGGHVASNVVGLQGVGVAEGLTPKGYVYCDRPAYKPGQLVHVRGILRQVAGDVFQIEAGKKYQVQVLDPRNRLIHEAEVALNDFGSFHTNFALPAAAVVGQYRIAVQFDERESYQGVFSVFEYRLEPIRLEIETARNVFYRGEEIEGTIRASYYYGAPLVNREVQYQLAGGRLLRATTNASGEIQFALPTRDFRESQPLELRATLAERGLTTARTLLLSTTGFSLNAKTRRPVYLAGETFEFEVAAADAEGQPVEREIVLQVLERTEVDGRAGEVQVARHTLKTAADGSARKTLKIDDGGQFVLRVAAADRFDNPITAQAVVHISDDQDRTRLRILSDRHTYTTGDTARVQLHWREEPALALVTFQGARILDYRLVTLQRGSNQLEIPLTSRLAPNFELAVAVMTDRVEAIGDQPARRFHAASSNFTVEQALKVELAARPVAGENFRPGDEIEVEVRASDPQGKPVAAEFSLALVEQALLEQFGNPLPAIDAFFRNRPRAAAVRTTSSVTFSYAPQTRAIDQRLLADLARREVAASENRLRTLLLDENGAGMDAPISNTAPGDAGGAASDGTLPGGFAGPGEWGMRTGGLGGGAGGAPAAGQQLQQFSDRFRSFGGLQQGQQQSEFEPQLGLYYNLQQARGNTPTLALSVDQTQSIDESSWYKRAAGVTVLGRQGDFYYLAMDGGRDALLGKLLERGEQILPFLPAQETGYWNPQVVTGDDGRAVLRFHLPDRSTGWTLRAKGITTTTLAGEASRDLEAAKPLFGQLKLPQAITDGDQLEVQVETHAKEDFEGQLEVTLKTTVGEETSSQTRRVDGKQGIHNLTFAQTIKLPTGRAGEPGGVAQFELTVQHGDYRDTLTSSVPIRPDGLPVFAAKGGTASGDSVVVVRPPEGVPLSDRTMQIIIGATVERSLLDAVLSTPDWCQTSIQRITGTADSTAADLLAALGLQSLFNKTRDAANPQATALDQLIRSAVGSLVSLQNDDGGWSWSGRGGASNGFHSARVLWALSVARQAGYRVADDTYNKAVGFVRQQLTAAPVSDYETRAVLLHALAAAGTDDFPLVNQLYRNRQTLSRHALVYVALTLAEMDRQQTAGELLQLYQQRPAGDAKSRLAWNRSDTELRALFALALQMVEPNDPRLPAEIDWLMAHRTGFRWSPDKATGPALLVLSRWFAGRQLAADKYSLTVLVNDLKLKELEIDPAAPAVTLDVPAEMLKDGQQQVRFLLSGRGRFTYQCTLGGFVPSGQLKSTTADWRVTRYYEPALLELDGETIPRGFNILQGSYRTFRNPLTQLPVGQRGRVALNVARNNLTPNLPDEQLDYLVVTEPLPAGVTVIEKTIAGEFERYEIAPGQITFYVGNRRSTTWITFEVHGYLAGNYGSVPTQVRNAYRPDQLAVADPLPLRVLPAGAKSEDAYRLSPVELYELGKRYFARGDLRQAEEHLGSLFQEWNLRSDEYRDTVRMLLHVHLEGGNANQVVRFFEIMIEKYPDHEIPFADFLRVGDAYDKLGEYERSYLVFRATVEASFMRESQVAGFLQNQGEFLRSVRVMDSLLRQYPGEAYLATASYALAQRVYTQAARAAEDPKLREQKVGRLDLIRRAWRRLDHFLTLHPDDPAADEASFSLATALLEMELFDRALKQCERYATRYPKSDYLDSFWYIMGYCHFARGEHAAAIKMCQQVAAADQLMQNGRREESTNKWRAVYILGQIYHSLGQAEKAIAEYTRVRDRFADARQAIEYFTRKQIKLPEVTTFEPGKAVKLALQHRNVARCETTVYKIDLMKFGLLRRDLSDVTNINLAGIRPYHESRVDLGDGNDYRDRSTDLEFPLRDEGAYLVVCRGDDLHASGLVLITPLTLEVQEDAESGRVRTTVKDRLQNAYQNDVHIKVIGSRNQEFVSGESDLRGVFIADGIQGRSMVIAEAGGGQYAFHRGQLNLLPATEQPASKRPQGKPSQSAAVVEKEQSSELLDGLWKGNQKIQRMQEKQLDSLYENSIKGGFGGGGVF